MKALMTCGGAFDLDDGRGDDLAYGAEHNSNILVLYSGNFRLLRDYFFKVVSYENLLHAP